MGLTAAAVVATLEFVFARKRQAVQWIISAVHHHSLLAGFGLHLLITTVLLMAAAMLVGTLHATLYMIHPNHECTFCNKPCLTHAAKQVRIWHQSVHVPGS